MSTIEQALAAAEHTCRERGVRFTPVRRRVLAILLEQPQPLTAYQILDHLRTAQPRAQPPTVYRALDFLLRQGLVHRIESTNSYLACNHGDEHTGESAAHWPQFLLCDECGDAREVPLAAELQHLLAQLAQGHGFHIGKRPLELHGLCRQCRSAA